MSDLASRGWDADFPEFASAPRESIMAALQRLVGDASDEQIRAWRDSIPSLQSEASEVLAAYAQAKGYGAVLEYVLPLDAPRPVLTDKRLSLDTELRFHLTRDVHRFVA